MTDKTRYFIGGCLLTLALLCGTAALDVTTDLLLQRGTLATIVLVSGDNTYVAEAPPGTAATAAAWRCQKISVSGGTTVVSWADGNADFDNTPGAAGAGLAALTYQ